MEDKDKSLKDKRALLEQIKENIKNSSKKDKDEIEFLLKRL